MHRALPRAATAAARRLATTRGRAPATRPLAAALLLLAASAPFSALGFHSPPLRCVAAAADSSSPRQGSATRAMASGGAASSSSSSSSCEAGAGNGSSDAGGGGKLPHSLMFGPYAIDEEQVFYTTDRTMAIVNLKPIVPGHILVLPHRVAVRFADLTREEVADLYTSVHEIAPKLEAHYKGEALTISIQDGKSAGQTVPHVHVHVLPRRLGDFVPNDQVYEELEAVHLKQHFDLDKDRRPRSLPEMAAEAAELRRLFPPERRPS